MLRSGPPSRPAVIGARGPVRRALAAHLASGAVTRVTYGTVIGLALVVALGAHPPTAAEATAAIVGTALAVALAELYSDVVGSEARTRRPVERAELRGMASAAGAVAFGAGFPAVFFVLAIAGVFDTDVAFTVSKWTGLVLIWAYGYVGSRLSGSAVGRAIVHASAVGAIGVALILLKALLH